MEPRQTPPKRGTSDGSADSPSRRRLTRLLPPLAGVLVSLLAHAAQNVWQLFHTNDMADAIRAFPAVGVAATLFLIGLVEGTVILCFYLPGTALLILLLLGLQPSWGEGLLLLGWGMAGTVAGYGLSVLLGRALKRRLPRLVGPASYERMRAFLERFGTLAFMAAAFHPNPLALAFALAGYLRVMRLLPAFLAAAVAQALWWSLYASSVSLLARQTVVTGNNFQLVLAGLFGVWLVYELLPGRDRRSASDSH